MMVKALDVLAKCASAYKTVKSAWSNIFVRLTVFAILIAIIAYFFGWKLVIWVLIELRLIKKIYIHY